MSTVNETVAGYIAAWNETDAGRRRDIVARTWSEDGSYLDAHRTGFGHPAIDAMIAAVQQRFLATAFACRLSDSYRATLAVCVGLQAAAAILIVRRAPRQPFV